ncbi:ABC transporter substrate-binding protein [Alkalibaculum sp. M08DMB]|uniref:ABC transporter substrate-binding protein n=1 Tax=Alkalibaculum sporogenes TaxID=2655001 RepID=A0A6A7K7L3_9FIRM|nr:ABC transporter substrate-binding protein [Alkalibaculum sporogenes]MPW25479.1 ABC transporter substrate-binding protein [Alkalibaculum sporogenes]
MKFRKISFILAIGLILLFTGCSNSATGSSETTETSGTEGNAPTEYPISIQHALGETVIESKPESIVAISWGNQDVPLSLGIVPAGVSKANYGVTDGSSLLPWTAEKFKELGVENPVVFDDTDGLDYEAISDAQPDVILAAYSGLTQEEYDLLSEIAPVVSYATAPWQTLWRDQILLDATGMGMKVEGEQLVSELEKLISEKTSELPQIQGKTAAFCYFVPTDLGKFYVYLPTDPRAAYLSDLGMEVPQSVTKLAEGAESFAIEISAENVDLLLDIDIIIAYGDDSLLEALQSDPLIGTIPAVARGSVVLIEDGSPLSASATPSALSIPATIDEYLGMIKEAADKVE